MVAEAFSTGGTEELATVRKAIEEKASDVINTAVADAVGTALATFSPEFTHVVKEELAAQRLSHPVSSVAQTTADLVIASVKKHLDRGGASATAGVPFQQRSLDDIRVAVECAISIPMIRRAHALALSVRVLALSNYAEAKGDCVTPFCPTPSKSAGTSMYAVKH